MLDEIQCINELKRGSYKAFTLIYNEYADYLFNFVQRQLHDRTAARDIVQDTFLKLWINRRQLNCFGNLKGFIFAIARYRIIDTLRRQMNQPRFEEYIEHLTDEPEDLSPEDIMMYDEFVGRLSAAKEHLTPRERQIYELSRDNHLTNRQIADMLGISEQTVKNHLSGALKALRAAIGGSTLIFLFWI